MRIVICHLTRMQRGYICAAGIDWETNQHVRAVLSSGRLTADLLSVYDGPFDMSAIVDLGETQPLFTKPHIEDHVVSPAQITFMRYAFPNKFWRFLEKTSKNSLCDVFGPSLIHVRNDHFGAHEGHGEASLGILNLSQKPRLYIRPAEGNRQPQLRMEFHDGHFQVDAQIADIRLYRQDHYTPDLARFNELTSQVKASRKVILSLGLTRAFAPSPASSPIHWLQVNNIHLAENPMWRLA